MKAFLSAAVLLAISTVSFAQNRIVRSINDGWSFEKEGKTETVDIPHCWNAHDTWDDEPGYYRGLCTYHRKIQINEPLEGKSVFVRFEGADQVCELVVNERYQGKHIGGYTAFVFDVTDAVHQGENDFLVRLDNSHNPDIPPLSADFTFYGGIYRDVELIVTAANHISLTHYATDGVYVRTAAVGKSSDIEVRTMLSIRDKGKYLLRQEVFDPDGKMVAENIRKITRTDECLQKIRIDNSRLWDVESPDVYRVQTTLCDSEGNVLDRVESPFGLRTFSFDVEKGFTLNGRPLKLIGTNRHQDYEDMGNALSDEMHVRDVELLKDMGGNFLRIAHYPQDPVITQLCDRYGIVCSVEIPLNNSITESAAFRENSLEMAREMVYQNYNNPSVIIWAYMNEVLLRPKYMDNPDRLSAYYASVRDLAESIDREIKGIDSSRYTMIPCHAAPARYHSAGLTRVPDIVGWNYYSGWYGRDFAEFKESVDAIHEMLPDKPFILTEYGAGVDPRVHSRKPTRFDFSSEYGLIFHKHYLDIIFDTPYIAGSNVWNLNDFYSEQRVDAVPHVNNKGLVGLDRVPKDSYLLYQARLLKTPFLAIGGREWKKRGGNEGERQTIEVYSNSADVTLFHNGCKVGTVAVVKGCADFTVELKDGQNLIAAESSDGLKDVIHVNYAAIPSDMRKFKEMNVSLGGDIYLEDDVRGAVWIPEQEYRTGSWGYVGGDVFKKPTSNHSLLPYTDADIFGTSVNPIFQTQRVGIESFKADVPDGKYYVYLYFAEIAVKPDGEPLPYNLGSDPVNITESNRSFNVSINGDRVLTDYNLKAEHGPCRAAIRKFTVNVTDGKGLSIDFGKVEGEPVLNAVRIYRCF